MPRQSPRQRSGLLRGSILVAWIIGLLALGVSLGGCRAQAEAQDTASSVAQLQLTVSPQPPAVGSAQVDVTMTLPNGTPVTGARLQIRGDMNMAGMQPVLADLKDLGNGHYQATDFSFTMAGDWVLTVTGGLPDGTTVKKTFTVPGVEVQAGSPTTSGSMAMPMAQSTATP
jgi:hypothetical protein